MSGWKLKSWKVMAGNISFSLRPLECYLHLGKQWTVQVNRYPFHDLN